MPHNWKLISSLDGDTSLEEPKRYPDNGVLVKTRLILHFDINETILVGDEAGGDTREDSLNKMLAKSAFCRMPVSYDNHDESTTVTSYESTSSLIPTHWWDGTEISSPPSSTANQQKVEDPPPLYTGWKWPEGCCPYYRTSYKKVASTFVQHHGHAYQDLYHYLQQQVSASHSEHPILSHMIPAFFETLVTLQKRQQPISIVFRTFGDDIQEIAKAMTAFCQGQHPDYPNFVQPEWSLPPQRLFQGRWTVTDDDNKEEVYQLFSLQDTGKLVASGDAEILQLLEETPVCGIRDDYQHWSSHNWEPSAGKPVWIPKQDADDTPFDHHLLFDDNIHNLPNDGIASIRKQCNSTFRTLSGPEIQAQQGVHLIRVPTVEPILNPNWFVEQIDAAQARLQARLLRKQE